MTVNYNFMKYYIKRILCTIYIRIRNGPPELFCKKDYLEYLQFHWEATVPESLFQ